MTTAGDIMHTGAECVREQQTLADAARIMKERDVGALPICGENEKLLGILTDRDIVLKCVAEGRDPSTVSAGELAQGRPMVVEADEDVEQVLRVMEQHLVRRLPVINHPDHKLVGMISEADIARGMPQERVAEFVTTICAE
ncbi:MULTISPECIES: CBS domain-containing protein [unclassified Kitasatospora]|uniref:CBS domain-containing protein n=1 Tax=unclassified Kitasatospora TaxID=2633591 RepID=UPI00070F5EDB|nr:MULTISPECIES: CBS domain-containing protein [unclassified Kitasatospora]KQV09849.1 hypoxic response protein 1 [Kitasatospora sp. Root107]KRB70088.1 hypoxic response protein 1 [Kitasatospora sp. Root187]